jgi:hypothetical protein
MNNLSPVDFRNAKPKLRRSPSLTDKKIWIWSLSILIIGAMSAWLMFLSWGLIEIWRGAEKLFVTLF